MNSFMLAKLYNRMMNSINVNNTSNNVNVNDFLKEKKLAIYISGTSIVKSEPRVVEND